MILDVPEVTIHFENVWFASQKWEIFLRPLLFNYSNVRAPFVFAQIKPITLSSVWLSGKVGMKSDTTFSLNQIGQLSFQ